MTLPADEPKLGRAFDGAAIPSLFYARPWRMTRVAGRDPGGMTQPRANDIII